MTKIWFEIEDLYVLSLQKCIVEPQKWINEEYPKDEHEVIHSLMIKGKILVLARHFECAIKLYTPEQVYEHVQITLQKYVEATGILDD